MQDQRPDNTKPTLERIDKVLLAVSLVGVLVTAAALGQDELLMRWFGPKTDGGEVIGEVTTAHNDVRRRTSRSLGWYNISANEKVYQRDTFFAGSESDVEFKLRGKNDFKLAANSLVVLDLKGNDVFIDLREGSIDSTGAVKLLMNDKLVSVKSDEVHITRDKLGSIDLSGGENGLDLDIDGQNIKAKKNEGVKIDKSLQPHKHEITITMKSFHNADSVWLAQGESAKFEWLARAPEAPVRLEITNAETKQKVFSKTITGQKLDWAPAELEKIYSYQFYDPKTNDAISSRYTLTVNSNTALTLISPARAELVDKDLTIATNQKVAVRFFWEKRSSIKGYHFVVASDPDFKNIESDKKVFKNQDTVEIAGGTHYWKVENLETPQLTSEVFDFTLGHAAIPLPAAQPPQVTDLKPDVTNQTPQLRTGDQRIQLHFKPPASGGRTVASEDDLLNPPHLEWQNIDGASNYRLEISKTADFSEPIIYDVLPNTEFSWQRARPGVYYWRVAGNGEGGDKSKTSPPGKMILTLEPPKLEAPAVADDVVEDPAKANEPKAVAIHWEALPYAAGYKVLDGESSSVAKTPEFNLNLPPGQTREVRVAALDESGHVVSPFASKRFNFDRRVVLREPQAISPNNDLTVVRFNKDDISPIVYRWSKVDGASEYEIELAHDAQFSKVIGSKKVKSNSLVVGKSSLTGTVYWRVRSVNGNHISGWSAPASYNIEVAKDRDDDN